AYRRFLFLEQLDDHLRLEKANFGGGVELQAADRDFGESAGRHSQRGDHDHLWNVLLVGLLVLTQREGEAKESDRDAEEFSHGCSPAPGPRVATYGLRFN